MYSREQILEIIERNMEMIGFPEEAFDTMVCVYNHIIEREEEFSLFSSSVEKYKNDKDTDLGLIIEEIKGCAERLAIHEYTMYMLLFLAMSDAMRDHYDRAGVDRKIFVNGLRDLKTALLVSLDIYGIWGHSVPTWQFGFLKGKILSFGRLQFQDYHLDVECTVDGIKLTPGTRAIFIHIPRTGARLDHDEVLASYKAAAEHFAPIFGDSPLVFACNSWLLYPRNLDFLSEKSNIRAFYKDFTIVQSVEYPDYSEVWRIFDVPYTGDPDKLPADSSLRRAYIDMIKRGEKTGRALGVFVFNQKNGKMTHKTEQEQ